MFFFFENFDFSKRLRAARKEKKLTQEQLASKISVSPATIRNYEAGKRVQPTAAVLLGLSNALDVSVDWLLGNDEYCAENAASKTASKEITKEDVKQAFQTLFSAFGATLSVYEDQLLNTNAQGVFLSFDDVCTSRYLYNYKKMSQLIAETSITDEKMRKRLLDAMFPEERFVPATSTSGGHFVSDNPDDADAGSGDK